LLDSAIALNAAFFVNAAILILAASTFFKHGIVVNELQQAHELLSPLVGTTLAGTLFAVALLAAGQSSTLTGTLAGQIIMEGFLHFKIRPFVRRLITRMVAIVPAVWVLLTAGESGTYGLLILSQVVLSLQLPFAILPLIHFTSDGRIMGEFANKRWVQALAWISAIIIIALNAKLVFDNASEFAQTTPHLWAKILVVLTAVLWGALLLFVIAKPFVDKRRNTVARERKRDAVFTILPEGGAISLAEPRFTKIGVTIAFSDSDREVLSHATHLARRHGAELCLFHVVEGVSGIVYGNEAFDSEAREDALYLERVAAALREQGLNTAPYLGFGDVPKAIIRLAQDTGIDLLVMGGHGHRGFADFLFGATISPVRHELSIPMVIVR
jgi:manganese transport protein